MGHAILLNITGLIIGGRYPIIDTLWMHTTCQIIMFYKFRSILATILSFQFLYCIIRIVANSVCLFSHNPFNTWLYCVFLSVVFWTVLIVFLAWYFIIHAGLTKYHFNSSNNMCCNYVKQSTILSNIHKEYCNTDCIATIQSEFVISTQKSILYKRH